MKAVNYLDWSDKYFRANTFDSIKIRVISEKIVFYSQPFKPELITELFEGWEEHFKQSDWSFMYFYYINNPYKYWQLGIKNSNEYYLYYFKYVNGNSVITKNYDFYKPTTLDDFIRDCQRAGIELTFNKKTVAKYF